MIKLLIFDFDGVIVDSKRLWASAIYRALKKRGCKFSETYVAERLGPKLKITLKNLNVKANPGIIKDVHDDVTKHINAVHLCRDIRYVEKIRQETKTILLTNSPGYFIEKALGKRKSYFDRILCAEDFGTKEDAIKRMMKKYNAEKNETVYVGDMKRDFEVAKKAGCKIFIVLAHAWDRSFWEKRKDKFIIKSLKELENAAGI